MSQMPEINTTETERDEIEIDLLDLFYFYRSKIVWIIAAFVIGALLAGVITQFAITPKYTATSTMYMVSSSSGSVVDLTDLNIGESLSQDYIELIKTRPIISSVIRMEDLDYNNKSFHEQLHRIKKIERLHTKEEILIVEPNEEESELLKLHEDEEILLIKGVAYTQDGEPLEYYELSSDTYFYRYRSLSSYNG